MISCILQGGLGNQMFQISAAVALAIENNTNYSFDFDNCYTPNQGNPSSRYVENIFKNIPRHYNVVSNQVHHETKFCYNKIPFRENLILSGYFQSKKYFENYEDQIKNLFSFEDVTTPTSDLLTSVHVRRGDYKEKSDYHRLLEINYYLSAIEYIGRGKFIFFSDDMDWVKRNFESENFIFSNFDNELEDIYLMSKCKNNIIANSSFSWWGAFMNKNDDKIVIAPKHNHWFGVRGPKDTQDLIPESWIQM